MMWQAGEWWNFGMGFGFHFVFWIALVALLVWLVTRLGGGTGGAPQNSSDPLEILKRRLARGELTVEGYRALVKEL